MKKIGKILLVFVLVFFASFSGVNAETLDQYIAKAEKNRAAYEKAKSEKELTEEEKARATEDKKRVEAEIESISNELEQIEKDIEKIEKDIKIKDKEIKEIMNFVQVANGENSYLEYAFGASDFTDFIYRVAVAEQLSSYNEELIEEYNNDVKNLSEKQKELNNKSKKLEDKKQQLEVLEIRLNKEIKEMQEGILDYESEYKVIMSYVNMLRSLDCKGYEDIKTCKNRINPPVTNGGTGGNITVPSTTGFYMPIPSGYITSDYGWRDLDGDGYKEDYHNGLDMSNRVHGSNIYPAAAGQVLAVLYPSWSGKCGNHIVYIAHNVKGRQYTTSYWHMTSIKVKPGQTVSANTPIGTMGGLHSEDSCSYGTHLHLNLFNGYTVSNQSPHQNPRNILPQAPGHGGYFSHR